MYNSFVESEKEIARLQEEKETLKRIIRDLQERVRELQDKNSLLKLRLEAQMEV